MAEQREQVKPSYWADFFRELKKRSSQPLGQPTFIFYFIFVIVLVGGLGVIIKLPRAYGSQATPEGVLSVAQDLSTYLLATLAAAFVDLNFSESSKQSLKMFALSMLIVGGFCAVYSNFSVDPTMASWSAIFGTVLALFVWWIANFDNAKLLEQPTPATVATGGNTDQIAGENQNVHFD